MRLWSRSQVFWPLVAIVVILGCSGRPTRTPEPVLAPAVTPTRAAAAIGSPTGPAPTATATRAPVPTAPAATITPAFSASAPFFVGISAGDTYRAGGIAVHGARAYVHQAMSEMGGPAISVVDLQRGEVERVISLGRESAASAGQLLLSPDGTVAFAVDPARRSLTTVDLGAERRGPVLTDVTSAALSPDGAHLYVAGEQGVRAYPADRLDAEPLWTAPLAGAADIAADTGRVAVTAGGESPALRMYAAENGALLQEVALPDFPWGLAPGPANGWAVTLGLDPLLIRFDETLNAVSQKAVPFGEDLYYDSPRDRFLITGVLPATGKSVVWALRAADLALLAEVSESATDLPDLFAALDDGGLVAAPRWGRGRLLQLDPETLQTREVIPLGVNLTDMALDDAGRVLYLADDQNRVHVVGLDDGKTREVWPGDAPLALDVANRRLYVHRDEGVVALDTLTGDVMARFAQHGMPAPDPTRDLVYIVDGGVTMYDRAGRPLGRLASTFPAEGATAPVPYAMAARVNPATGNLVVVMNNGVPGSNNRSFLRIYQPQSDRSLEPPTSFSFVQDLVFDSDTGALFVSYGPAMNLEAIQALSSTGEETGRLAGRTGALALDRDRDTLYAVAAGALAEIDSASLELRGVYQAPREEAAKMLPDPPMRRLYILPTSGPRLRVLDLTALEPVDMQPVAEALPATADVTALHFAEDGGRTWLYLTNANNAVYRAAVKTPAATDELAWERLPVGSLASFPYLTVLPGGVIYRTGQGNFGGDGVWRSLDGGQNWELLASGLADLRGSQAVQAAGVHPAYFVSRTAGIYAWEPGAPGHWEQIVAPTSSYDFPGNLHLAPDGTLFLQSYGALQRSTDGREWESLSVREDLIAMVGFHPDEDGQNEVYAMFCSPEACEVSRSRDQGESWELVLGLPAYSAPLQLQAEDESLYLFGNGFPAPSLYRSRDDGATWETVAPESLPGVTALGVAPDGMLWLGFRGGVRQVDAESLAWAATGPLGSSRGIPPAAPPTPPTALSSSCDDALSPVERGILAGAPGLGCPRTDARPLALAVQPFENGQMIWQSDERIVLVLNGDGAWQAFPDAWTEGQPASDPELSAPKGRMQPIRGFGKVWRERLGGPQSAVGWALAPEKGVAGEVQDWSGGRAIRYDGEWFVFFEDGRWVSSGDVLSDGR